MGTNAELAILSLDPTLLEDVRSVVALARWCAAGRLARTSTLEDALGLACLGDAVEGLGAPGEPSVRWPHADLEGAIREAARRVIDQAAQHTGNEAACAEWWDMQSARAERVLGSLGARRP